MKKSLKCLFVILVMLITLFSFTITALAQTTTQDGLQVNLTTDKQSYSLNEDIEITVSVTNTNDFTVKDVSIEALLPDNFELKDSKQNTSAKAVDLKAGENVTLKLTALVKGEEQTTEPTTNPIEPTKPVEPSTEPSTEPTTESTTNPTTNSTENTKPSESTTKNNTTSTTETTTKVNAPLNVKETTTNNNNKLQSTTEKTKAVNNNKNGKSPYTGVDYTLLAIFFVIFFFSICGLLYCLLVHTKKTKKAISSVLCFVIAVTSVIGFTSYKAYADDREFSTITISEQIKVDNKDYTIFANVKYQVGGINLAINNKENTVTDFNQTLRGTFSSTSNVVSVTYTIATEIDDYEITDSGTANINDNRYSADIQLKPENNRITVTATTDSGKTESKTVNVKYDSGKLYKTDKSHISFDSETKTRYVNNIVLVYFNEGVSDDRRNEIVSSINGKVVGTLNGVNQWQVEVATTNLKGLEEICTKLENMNGVFAVHIDKVVKVSPDIAGNDPWTNANDGNWYLDAIDAYSAWNYNERFKKINIGIVDSGFDTAHEDLNGIIKFPKQECELRNIISDHGTHVAGIIGAKANNGIGITGLLWNTELYCVDWEPEKSQEWNIESEVLSGLTYNVEAGAKAVNYSLGLTASAKYDEWLNSSVDVGAKHASDVMVELLSKNKDFIVVQSSGNGTEDGYSIDAIYNGFFASITEKDINIPENSKLTKQDILDRIIVVGNAERKSDGNYQQHISSNGGTQVDICAPGTDIFSTVPGGDNGSYASLTGTSMAAPMVTAVCGMVWSVNDKFTGTEVKNIVCNSYDKNIVVWNNPDEKHTTNENYRMLNAKLAVEEALKGSVSGCVKEATDKAPIKDVEVRALDEKGTVIEKTKTDENGNFTLSLPAGKYTLNIGGELGATTEYSYETYKTDITVDSNVWTVLKDDILLNCATMRIAGNVYDSESKEPLADVEVKTYRVVNGTSEYVSSGTSNANGEYLINISKNGTYNLEFTKSGYTTATQNSVMTFGNLTYAEWQYLVKDNTGGIELGNVGDTIEFGSYPQTRVQDDNLISQLNNCKINMHSYGYTRYIVTSTTSGEYIDCDMEYGDIIYNGKKYRKVYFSNYRSWQAPNYTYSKSKECQSENGYISNNEYWFEWNPIKWRILSIENNEVYIMSENIIDSQEFDTLDKNNWENTSLRKWLNEDFYQCAFSENDKSIISLSTHSNKGSSADNTVDHGDIVDYIWLLSYDDIKNSQYGFSTSVYNEDKKRQSSGTDYAKCQGLYVDSETGNSSYRLITNRSSFGGSCQVSSEGTAGYISSYKIWPLVAESKGSYYGIRPVLKLNL